MELQVWLRVRAGSENMIELEFDEPTHAYTLNGRRVPSVTQVLDPLNMLDGIPWDILEAARIFGSNVHVACHFHNIGILDWSSLDEYLASYVRGYLKFLAESSFVVLASEERVASVKAGYAGTLDIRGVLNRRKALIDIKSTSSLPRTVGPQTAAYENALREMTGEKTERRFCLHLKPDDYSLVPLKDGRGVSDLTCFVSALNVWRFRNASM